MVYAVMRDTIQTSKGDYYQDEDYTETIELYFILKDANTRVRAEYEDWNGDVSNHEEFNFDFTGGGTHFWEMLDTLEVEGVRVYVKEEPVKGPGSEPVRVWKRALPGEGSEEGSEKDSDEDSDED
ncbi:hypothetical protein GLAREA_08952 [Glarea lozoyensis ATCC 20868]|uniref:Uncharacterized protein n=1 Tax=Glarea lozoyensis (strain ATCC 20868 / MF5171) TaxID=1116229 RepID=S3DI40_GLAL2|nr:uncharacterized protein GLAREA_08952 [Glarea lozoyensis ATCC 20868]EPE36789.1 hypothetical protein GLAREA_08952 [Glarea lozoyensis ATCC 20868]